MTWKPRLFVGEDLLLNLLPFYSEGKKYEILSKIKLYVTYIIDLLETVIKHLVCFVNVFRGLSCTEDVMVQMVSLVSFQLF